MGYFSHLRNRIGEWFSPTPDIARFRDFETQVTTPLTQLQQMIKVTGPQMQSTMNAVQAYSWTKTTKLEDQSRIIKKQLDNHNKQSWPIRWWKEWTGQAKDIAHKRLWFAYQQCKPLSQFDAIQDIPENTVAISNRIARLKSMRSCLPTTWYQAIQRVQADRYIKKWPPIEPGNFSSTQRSSGSSRLSEPSRNDALPSESRGEVVLSNALVVFHQLTQPLTASEEKNLRLTLFACGFFNLDVNTATPDDIRKKLRESYLQTHPDKLVFKFIDRNGIESVLPEKASARYKADMEEIFHSLSEKFGTIPSNDQKLIKLSVKLSQSEITTIVKQGRDFRQGFDRIATLKKEIVTLIARDEELKTWMEQMRKEIAETQQTTREIEAKSREMDAKIEEQLRALKQQKQQNKQRPQSLTNANGSQILSDIGRTQANDVLHINRLFTPRHANRVVIPVTAATPPGVDANPQPKPIARKLSW